MLATYLGGDTAVFKCPADSRFGIYVNGIDTDPAKVGKIVPAARSISMNQAVGTMDPGYADFGPHSGKPTRKVYGPWLSGRLSFNYSQYVTFGGQTDFGFCAPSGIFILSDEDPYSINDASLAFSVGVPEKVDYPATYHDNGCGISFADGHAETHIWKTPVFKTTFYIPIGAPGSPSYDDWFWMASHTSKSTLTGTVP